MIARYSGGRYWGVLQYFNKNGEIMVARYSGGHDILGPVLGGFTVLINIPCFARKNVEIMQLETAWYFGHR